MFESRRARQYYRGESLSKLDRGLASQPSPGLAIPQFPRGRTKRGRPTWHSTNDTDLLVEETFDFAAWQPPLISSPGVKTIDGVAIGPKSFGESLPLRGQMPIAVEIDGPTSTTRVIQSPVFNAVAGAMAIQAGIDQFETCATCVPPR